MLALQGDVLVVQQDVPTRSVVVHHEDPDAGQVALRRGRRGRIAGHLDGNVLVAAWEYRSREEALAAGVAPGNVTEQGLWAVDESGVVPEGWDEEAFRRAASEKGYLVTMDGQPIEIAEEEPTEEAPELIKPDGIWTPDQN